jgi:CubicO group peptidase (beta-lactamase class C family)
VNHGLAEKAFPGCQVLVAKNGNVFFQKSYGWHTYNQQIKVNDYDLFDWASVTKVTGPLPALMQLVDEGKLDVEKPLSNYWPSFKNSNKENIKITEFLSHQSGIPAWLPFWQLATGKKNELRQINFRNEPADSFKIRVYENLYLRNSFKQTFFETIRDSKLGEKKYLYSDLSFHIYPEIISNLTRSNYEDFVKNNFYRPLGAATVTYNPYRFFHLTQIVPTETDTVFRHANIHGFVHDEGAAMLGGVSGNAGLFGCANDLAKIFQMYLQKGFYGGKRYISEITFNRFNTVQFPENNNRRALGFDKPISSNQSNNQANSYPARDASAASFGHTGFTGNMVWADPDNGLLYIFLSNRVHPTRENNKISDLNIRIAIQNEIYNCIEKGLQ